MSPWLCQELMVGIAGRIHDDPGHSERKRRELIVGNSAAGRLLLVSFTERRRRKPDGLAREYRLDYKMSRPNRFAARVAQDAVVIVLDSDVAEVFRDPKQVISLLRATIAAVEKPRSRRAGVRQHVLLRCRIANRGAGS